MNKKGVLITLLMVQLVLITVIAIIDVESERESFAYVEEFNKIGAYKIASIYDNLIYEHELFNGINALSSSEDEFFLMVNSTFDTLYDVNLIFNGSYIYISDNFFDFYKEGEI